MRSSARAAGGALAMAAAAGALLAPGRGPDAGGARADEPKPAVAAGASGVSGPGCVVRGIFPGPKGTQIYDAPAGGRAVAAFTGALQPMVLSDFSADPTVSRARLGTSWGSAALRVDGWVNASSMAVFTTRDVPIIAGHVWISDAQKVRLVQAANGSLTGEMAVPGTSGQTVRASAPCDAFTLQPGAPAAMVVPGDGRGYLSRGAGVELFEEPGGSAMFTLKVAEGTAQLFWSTETRAGFVHVRTRGALTVDAWARQRDLEPLKKGEMMDQFVPPTTTVAAAALKLDGEPRLVRMPRDVPFRARRDDKERPIGVIEAGAEVFVIETMVGSTNVLPKNLGIMPEGDGGFWIPATEIPK